MEGLGLAGMEGLALVVELVMEELAVAGHAVLFQAGSFCGKTRCSLHYCNGFTRRIGETTLPGHPVFQAWCPLPRFGHFAVGCLPSLYFVMQTSAR